MAKVTLVFAILLVALGLVGYVKTGSVNAAALIPAWYGLALGLCGFLAISRSERRRKIFMHINAALGVLGFLGAAAAALNSYGSARSEGIDPDRAALAIELTMAGLLLIYINLCVQSFLAARRSRQE
jgi:hypothetical protein